MVSVSEEKKVYKPIPNGPVLELRLVEDEHKDKAVKPININLSVSSPTEEEKKQEKEGSVTSTQLSICIAVAFLFGALFVVIVYLDQQKYYEKLHTKIGEKQ
ncbi:hypothetical protein NECID01_1817 [Nematocida sp. AWRm77]|nr:hypothetical protein NECID01_1817 [Nematocida sp. AWRm77]